MAIIKSNLPIKAWINWLYGHTKCKQKTTKILLPIKIFLHYYLFVKTCASRWDSYHCTISISLKSGHQKHKDYYGFYIYRVL